MKVSTVIVSFKTIAGKPLLPFIDDWLIGRGLFNKAVIYARESTRQQRGNLDHQLGTLYPEVGTRGIEIIGAIGVVESGRTLDRDIRRGLYQALEVAEEANAIIVANNLDCILCGPCGNDPPKPEDLHALDNHVIATLVPPDASPAAKRSEETRRGMAASSKGGRVPVDEALILQLQEEPLSVRQIAKQAGVSRTAVHDVLVRNGIDPHVRAVTLGGRWS